MADPQGVRVSKRAAGMSQRVIRSAVGGRGERLHEANLGLILGILGGAEVSQSRKHGLGGGGIAAQRGEPAPIAGEILVAGQAVGLGTLGEFGLGAVPVTKHHQRLGQVGDRDY